MGSCKGCAYGASALARWGAGQDGLLDKLVARGEAYARDMDAALGLRLGKPAQGCSLAAKVLAWCRRTLCERPHVSCTPLSSWSSRSDMALTDRHPVA